MSQPILALSGVTKRYPPGMGGQPAPALEGLYLRVKPGHVLGLLGPNGSGKSTALKIAMGLCQPDEGGGEIDGDDLGSSQARRKTGYLPERGGLPLHLTARESLEMWCALNGTDGGRKSSPVGDWLDRVGLAATADRRVGTFSKGMRQRLGLAQAMILNPRLLLLDEPFSGVDPLGVDLLVGLVREQAGWGTAIVLTSHLLHRVEEVCDWVIFLNEGRILAQGDVGDLLDGPKSAGPQGLEAVYRKQLAEAQVS